MLRRLLGMGMAVLGGMWILIGSGEVALAQREKPRTEKSVKPKAKPELDAELKTALAHAPTAAQWPNHDYARILDIGNVTIKPDGTVVAEYRETYKLFNERGRRIAEVNLPYNSSYQSLRVLQARTIRKDGSVAEVKPEDFRLTAPYQEYLLYDDAVATSFSMPAVEDDCVIDYTFQMTTRPVLMPGHFWTYWGFSGPEPVGLCRYTLRAPADKPIQYKVYNDETLKPTITPSTDGKTKTYVWERRNIQPIEIEPAMPPISDVRIWMEATSLTDWQEIAAWYWRLQKPQAAPYEALRSTVTKLLTGKQTEEEKARTLYDWVANRVRYVGIEMGLSAYKPHLAKEVHEKLYGDCKDKATLLITMLGLAGIKAHPVLLKAEERRSVRTGLPSLNAFNHCIALAEIGGKEVWLDATAEAVAYGDIPHSDRGVEALVIREGKGEFQTIPSYRPEESGMQARNTLTLAADGSAVLQSEISLHGAMGQAMRMAIRSLTPDKRRDVAQRFAQMLASSAKLKSFTVPDGIEKLGPYTMQVAAQVSSYSKKTGSLLLVPLMGTSNVEQRNPFVRETRVWPVVEDDASLTQSETTITLPEGYAIEETPADVHLTGPLFTYHRTLTRAADNRTLTLKETLTGVPGRIPATDYPKLKASFEEIIKASEDQIILKKRP